MLIKSSNCLGFLLNIILLVFQLWQKSRDHRTFSLLEEVGVSDVPAVQLVLLLFHIDAYKTPFPHKFINYNQTFPSTLKPFLWQILTHPQNISTQKKKAQFFPRPILALFPHDLFYLSKVVEIHKKEIYYLIFIYEKSSAILSCTPYQRPFKKIPNG